MKSILIRELPGHTLDALKRLAKLHHRSLQGELHAILARAAAMAPAPETDQELDLHFAESGQSGVIHREDMYDEHGR